MASSYNKAGVRINLQGYKWICMGANLYHRWSMEPKSYLTALINQGCFLLLIALILKRHYHIYCEKI